MGAVRPLFTHLQDDDSLISRLLVPEVASSLSPMFPAFFVTRDPVRTQPRSGHSPHFRIPFHPVDFRSPFFPYP
jgi:hypothetical protein